MDNRVVVKVNRNLATVDRDQENAIQYLNHATRYTYTTTKLDVAESRRTRKNKYITTTHEGWHYSYSDDGSKFIIPRGLVDMLPNEMFRVDDESEYIIKIPELNYELVRWCLDEFELRPDQIEAVCEALINKRGILQIATGAGKSVIITAITKLLIKENPDIRILIIAPFTNIINQLNDYMRNEGISDKNVTICTSMSGKVTNTDNLIQYNALIIDEVQHAGASSYFDVGIGCINAEYAIGLSAKVVDDSRINETKLSRFTHQEARAIGITGRVLVLKTPGDCIDEGILATPVLMTLDFTHASNLAEELDWRKVVNQGIMNHERLALFAIAASVLSSYDRRVLILVLEKRQGYDIAEWIGKIDSSIKVGVSYGGNKGHYYHHNEWSNHAGYDVLQDFKNGDFNILIGSTSMDEGADIHNLDACIIAGGGKNPRRLIQKVGRALRVSKTGKYAYVIDCEDKGSCVLQSQFRKRLMVYSSDIGITGNRICRSIPIALFEAKFKSYEGLN